MILLTTNERKLAESSNEFPSSIHYNKSEILFSTKGLYCNGDSAVEPHRATFA